MKDLNILKQLTHIIETGNSTLLLHIDLM